MKHKNLIGTLVLLFAIDAHSAIVAFDPDNASASVGDTFTLTMRILRLSPSIPTMRRLASAIPLP